MRAVYFLLASFALCAFSQAERNPNPEHIVLIVWDGMRPDFITSENTPALHALAQQGTFFANHHSIYVTSTEVNGTAIATGCYPDRNGILANREYRPDINPLQPIAMEGAENIRKGDAVRGGAYLRAATLAEIVQRAGHRTAIAGTKPVALLHDRSLAREPSHGSPVLFAGKTLPSSAFGPLLARLGPFPESPPPGVLAPNGAQNTWTTQALLQEFWREGIPKFSTLWLGEPDFSQHLTQAGSATALAALKNCDADLAAVLAALEAKGARETTDVFVVSDHGFSTVERAVELSPLFQQAGLKIVREYAAAPAWDEILQITLGGSAQFYVPGHDAGLVQKLVAVLQASDFAGPIFTRAALPGTFAPREARIESADSPDVIFSYRWRDGKNGNGVEGLVTAEGRRAGFGTHASLSRFDIHNFLLAAGPDIRTGFKDSSPSANVDLAPTILHLLGIAPPTPMDGRVLLEALASEDFDAPKPVTKTLEAAISTPAGLRRQTLKITTFAGYRYLDEGNASHESSPGSEK